MVSQYSPFFGDLVVMFDRIVVPFYKLHIYTIPVAKVRDVIKLIELENYLIVIERAPNNFAAYSADVPGCIATGDTYDETVDLMREALAFHFEGLRDNGQPIPLPASAAECVTVSVAPATTHSLTKA